MNTFLKRSRGAKTLLCALVQHAVIARYLPVLRHLGRHAEKLPAEVALTTMQLQILAVLLPKYLSAQPTVGEAMRAVARLGGHLRSNGPPGWQVIGRGWQRLKEYECAFELGLQAKGGIVINHEGVTARRDQRPMMRRCETAAAASDAPSRSVLKFHRAGVIVWRGIDESCLPAQKRLWF